MTIHVNDPGAFGGPGLALLNLMRGAGVPVGMLPDGYTLPNTYASVAAQTGLLQQPCGKTTLSATPLAAPPRISLYRGPSIGYPYWAYYAHALLASGLLFRCVDAKDLKQGALEKTDLLVMPGGFATWGLDRAENLTGIDNAILTFLDNGGAYIGSCGGAFYTAEGRPHWIGTFRTVPLYTQEYLLTGAGLVSVSLDESPLSRGLPPAIELPYYHGPIFEPTPVASETAGTFRSLVIASRLFIDNPLSQERFAEMAGRPAILWRSDERARVVAFSPHPEMGEYLRRGMLLKDYIPHYLPIRGTQIMEETLSFLGRDDAAGFRLIANAVDALCPSGPRGLAPTPTSTGTPLIPDNLHTLIDHGIATLHHLAQKSDEKLGTLIRNLVISLKRQWQEIISGLETIAHESSLASSLATILAHVAEDAMKISLDTFHLAEVSVLTELPIRLCSVSLRCLEMEHTILHMRHE